MKEIALTVVTSSLSTVPAQKRCPKCGETKPAEGFGPNRSRKDGLQGHCKDCRAEAHANTYDARLQKAVVVDATRKKKCTKCGKMKPVGDFYRLASGKDGYASRCKECQKGAARVRYTNNREEILRRNRERLKVRIENGETPWSWQALRSRYKLGRKEYEEILEAQGGGCAICGARDNGSRRFHVDHDHSCCETEYRSCGRCIRGLLCFTCNLMLGSAGDDERVLLRAVMYLRKGRIEREVPERHAKVNGVGGRPRGRAKKPIATGK